MKENQFLPLIWHSDGPKMVFMELEIKALHPAHVDMPKMVQSRSLAPEKMCVRQFMSGIQHQGSETPCSFLVDYACRSATLCRMAPLHSVTYMRPRGSPHTTQPRVNDQRLASKPFCHTERRAKRDLLTQPRSPFDYNCLLHIDLVCSLPISF